MESRITKSNDGKQNTKVKWWKAEYQSQMMESGIPKSKEESMICIINTFIYWWQHNFSKMRDLGPYILSNSATLDCSACAKLRKYTVMYIYVVDVCILPLSTIFRLYFRCYDTVVFVVFHFFTFLQICILLILLYYTHNDDVTQNGDDVA